MLSLFSLGPSGTRLHVNGKFLRVTINATETNIAWEDENSSHSICLGKERICIALCWIKKKLVEETHPTNSDEEKVGNLFGQKSLTMEIDFEICTSFTVVKLRERYVILIYFFTLFNDHLHNNNGRLILFYWISKEQKLLFT